MAVVAGHMPSAQLHCTHSPASAAARNRRRAPVLSADVWTSGRIRATAIPDF